ncbi:hypothetical protein AVEN_14559-1 [Araneus ventricosus]|uniref:WAP domain-containing protein n=1 Tax=Araneus ventricosus TaxID=182803 RepID=A0A4Y2CGZ6_ARAVE|nr:hypothetical protein AVEN_14559-1 [Araneus ventricosus]
MSNSSCHCFIRNSHHTSGRTVHSELQLPLSLAQTESPLFNIRKRSCKAWRANLFGLSIRCLTKVADINLETPERPIPEYDIDPLLPVDPEGCLRNREEAAARGRQCLRKCASDADCISTRKRCLCDGLCGWSCIRPGRTALFGSDENFIGVHGLLVLHLRYLIRISYLGSS